MSLPLSFYSLFTQRVFSQTSNISYAVRGVNRTYEAPEDRKMDNNFRDFQMSFLTNTLTEIGFRAIQTLYVIPRMTEALQLNRLSELYADRYPGQIINNYDRMPEFIRARMMGTLVRGSIPQVPDLLEKMEADLLRTKGQKLSAQEKLQLSVLLEHMHKNLNYKDYIHDLTQANGRHVTPQNKLTEGEAKLILAQRERILTLQSKYLLDALTTGALKANKRAQESKIEGLRKLADAVQEQVHALGTDADIARFKALDPHGQIDSILKQSTHKARKNGVRSLIDQTKAFAGEVAQNQEAQIGKLADTLDWAKELPKGLNTEQGRQKLLNMIREGVNADNMFSTLKHIQANGTWPQMALSVALMFACFGTVGSWFDVKVLQPWQEKQVKERGTSSFYTTPSYLATLPGLSVLGFGMQNKMQLGLIRNLSYFNRFAVVGTASLLAYGGSFLYLLKRAMKNTPKIQQTTPSATPVGVGNGFSVGRPAMLPQPSPFAAVIPTQQQANPFLPR